MFKNRRKLLFVGNCNAGKTTLINKTSTTYMKCGGSKECHCTDCVDYTFVESKGHPTLCDLNSMRDVDGVFIVVDVSKPMTQSLNDWCSFVRDYNFPNTPVIILYNKCDLVELNHKDYNARKLEGYDSYHEFYTTAIDKTHINFWFDRMLRLIGDNK